MAWWVYGLTWLQRIRWLSLRVEKRLLVQVKIHPNEKHSVIKFYWTWHWIVGELVSWFYLVVESMFHPRLHSTAPISILWSTATTRRRCTDVGKTGFVTICIGVQQREFLVFFVIFKWWKIIPVLMLIICWSKKCWLEYHPSVDSILLVLIQTCLNIISALPMVLIENCRQRFLRLLSGRVVSSRSSNITLLSQPIIPRFSKCMSPRPLAMNAIIYFNEIHHHHPQWWTYEF